MSTAKRLLKGSIVRNADLCIALGATFIIAPLIVRSLGNRMYGFWTLIGTFLGYYGLLDFGLSTAASRFLSRSLGKGDIYELNEVANNVFFLFCLIGAAAAAATIVLVWACPHFIHDQGEAALFRKILLLLGAATAVGFPMRVYGGILTSYIRYEWIGYISIARTLVSNVAIYHYLSNGGGMMGIAVISFVVSLLQYAATYAVCTTLYPDIGIILFHFESSKIRTMLDYSWKTFVCQIADVFRFQMDSLLIAGVLSVSLVTPYAIGARITDGFNQLVLSSVGTMLPVFSRYEGSGDFDAVRSTLLRVTRLSALLSAFIGFSVIFYAQAFIRRWMGPGYESSRWVTDFLCVGLIIGLPQSPGIQLLFGLSKHDYYTAMIACEAAANLVLSLCFMRRYGIYGVALGTMVEMMVFKVFVQPVYICRSIGLPVRTYLFDAILATLAKTALPLGVFFYLIRRLVLPSYARLCACAVVQALLFLPAAYFFILGRDERAFVKALFASIFERAALNKSEGANAAA